MSKHKQNNYRVDTLKIREIVKEKEMTVAGLSRLIGLTRRQYLHNRLHNICPITADELIKIAEVLGVKVESLKLPEVETA